jgi:hypothetical protein
VRAITLSAHTLVLLVLVLGLGCEVGGGRRPRDSGTTGGGDAGDAGGTDAFVPPRPDAGPPGCNPFGPRPGLDEDGDGWGSEDGDCDDCSNVVNPGAFDFPGNMVDEDCSGTDATASEHECDTSLALDSADPNDAARAIGLCRFTDESSGQWGVISARFTRADGAGSMDSPLQSGILPRFGSVAAPHGGSMLALSSGIARAPDQPGYTTECDLFGTTMLGFPFPPDSTPFPAGFPVESPACPGVTTGPVYNAAGLEVRIRVPTNARSLAFRSNFYTYEYPEYICSEYNDFFVTLMTPRPDGLVNDNIVFDTDGNLVSVNASLLQVCEPGTHGGRTFSCPRGTALLAQTGFDGTAVCGTGDVFGTTIGQSVRAATGWLSTTAPVERGEIITLRFTVWDSGDPDLDSLVLIDGVRWEIEDAPVRTVPDLI